MKNYEYIKSLMCLYAVTDRSWCDKMSLEEMVDLSLLGGATLIQLREKKIDDNEFLRRAISIQNICKKFNVPLIINDNVQIAKKICADGVHIGQSDMNLVEARKFLGDSAIIGVSAHNTKEALEAQKNGADYLGLGAAFSTNTKTDVDVMTYKTMCDITSAVNIPTCAIGGICKDNMRKLQGTGIDGVAVVSAIFASSDIKKSTEELFELSNQLFA